MDSSTCISDAHIATEDFIQEATFALAIPEKSKVEDGTNVVADEKSETPFVPFAPLASSTCISDAHIGTEEFIKEATLALDILEDDSNVVVDENSDAPFVPSAPLASSTCISDAHITAEEFIKEVTLALEVTDESKLDYGSNVVADDNSKATFVPSAPLGSSPCISDTHITAEELIKKEVTLALKITDESKLDYGTNVVADDNRKATFVPSAPLASSACSSDAHITAEELIKKEVTLALEIADESKLENGTNVVADDNSKAPFVPSAPLASFACISDAHITAEELIKKEVTLALEIADESKLENGTNVVADDNSKAPFVPSAPLANSACISDAHITAEELIKKEVTLALEIADESKLENSTNVVADENSKATFVPSAPLASSACISDAHITAEELIKKEVTLALEIADESKLENGTNVVADDNSKAPFVPSAPLASSACISDAHITAEELIKKDVTLALEIADESKLENGTNVVADENSKAIFVPSAPLDSCICISDVHIATEDFIQEATHCISNTREKQGRGRHERRC